MPRGAVSIKVDFRSKPANPFCAAARTARRRLSAKARKARSSALRPDSKKAGDMPQKGPALTPREIGVLRGWIDQGLQWPQDFTFGFRRAPLAPRRPDVPKPPAGSDLRNPIDLFIARSLADRGATVAWKPVSDRVYARRVALDLVGLLPTPQQIQEFEADVRPDQRDRFVAARLDDRRDYAEHWLSFWNDALRNAYRGTGFIDGGRLTLTGWLFKALYDNQPYNKFVHELVSPPKGSGAEAFTKGIVWRGVVNASQAPPVQAAQNVAQVFLGTNLKCASCHDSFVNYWKLTDAYALASVFSEKPLEIHRCDKPTGKTSTIGFVYPELGDVDDHAPAPRDRNAWPICSSNPKTAGSPARSSIASGPP